MEDKEASRTPDHESKDEKLHLDLSPVSDLIKSLSGTVEEKSKRHYKDEIELGSPGKGKVRVYRTSQVIEQDGILEQAIFLFPSVVSINVGGYNYHSTSYTLTQYPDSRLAKMCNGIVPLSKDVRGNTFIDRDGETFRYILSFLRTKKLKLPLDFKSFDELEAEAEYFEIYDLVEELKKEKSKYTKQNSYIRLSYFSKKKGVVLAGEVKNLVEIIPKPIPGAQLKTGEDFHFSTGEKVVQGAQMEIPLKPTQVDALVQHIIDAGYVIEGSKVMFDGNDQTWVFVRRIN
ncbi:uncharacterized protein LOC110251881 [Exaiptasia diaphana]|uniref:BTB domain-containing protein n=1 Tax=Exaiptasia diaphana TaxID=2652724 RepID=A0A913XE87_EXADI|nr:uncharacterized protein LOC110241243 [Exaiptasia diaphana]XP_020914290.1 uncharacterized protein LOC110251881 [Exaiptasia diaphana]KXJ06994.1 BTB/POZ domain-containing protein kctd15 [Exaiptasia diaphana]